MKEQFKKELTEAPELIQTVYMQTVALHLFMKLLGFYPNGTPSRGFVRKHNSNFKNQFLSLRDAVAIYNQTARYQILHGVPGLSLCSPTGASCIAFDQIVLTAASKQRIFDKIGLQWSKKKRMMVSTKSLLKFN